MSQQSLFTCFPLLSFALSYTRISRLGNSLVYFMSVRLVDKIPHIFLHIKWWLQIITWLVLWDSSTWSSTSASHERLTQSCHKVTWAFDVSNVSVTVPSSAKKEMIQVGQGKAQRQTFKINQVTNASAVNRRVTLKSHPSRLQKVPSCCDAIGWLTRYRTTISRKFSVLPSLTSVSAITGKS